MSEENKKATKFMPASFREARQALGMSQENFARAVGISVNTVRKWEQGKCNPHPLSLQKVKNLQERYIEQYNKPSPRSRETSRY